jgi:hypothetical protein
VKTYFLPGKFGFEGKAKLRLQTVKTQRKTSPALGFRCLCSKKGRASLAFFCYLNRQKVGFHFLT